MSDTVDFEFLKTRSVLYVEDEEMVRENLSRYLKRRFPKLDVATNGQEGLELFNRVHHDIVITDINMPIMDGLEMAKLIKTSVASTPIIVVTAYNEVDYFMSAIEIGVQRFVKKPVDPALLVEAIYNTTLARYNEKSLETERVKMLGALTDTLSSLTKFFEKGWGYEEGHHRSVAFIAVEIGAILGMSPFQIDGLKISALLHDIGNLAAPTEVLAAHRSISAEEKERLHCHVVASTDLLKEIDFPWPVAKIVSQHHERFDGSGYPGGLKGNEITREAQILAVAEVMVAMLSVRPWRGPVPPDDLVNELRSNSGSAYAPDVVDVALGLLNDGIWKRLTEA